MSMVKDNSNHLYWYDITVKAKAKKFSIVSTNGPLKETKTILDRVSGNVKSGELVAIIGSSGAGKTTLLEVLSGTLPKGFLVSGKITFKTLIPQLTVKEYLWYQVNNDPLYRRDGNRKIGVNLNKFVKIIAIQFSLRVSKMDKKDSIAKSSGEKLLQEVGLGSVQNTVIGDTDKNKALSGGEIRRLALASELIGNPKFLFLDEPTSGLDSFAAKECVDILKQMTVKRGICAICTIHQPSSTTLSYFDKIILMTPLGKPAYQGDVNSALEYFKNQLGLECPMESNPCDFFIKHVSLSGIDEGESFDKIRNICQIYQDSVGNLATYNESDDSFDTFNETSTKFYATSTSNQIKVLLWKELLWFIRFPSRIWVYSNRSIMLSFFFSCLYWQQPLSYTGARNLTAAICELTRYFGNQQFFNGGLGLNLAELENDYKNNLYSIHSYLISRTFFEMIYCTVDTVIISSVLYWSIGLDETVIKWAVFLGLMLLSNIAASTTGELVRLMCPGISYFYETFVTYSLISLIFGGYFIRLSSISPYVSWIKYLISTHYSGEVMMINQWNNIQSISCEEKVESICYKSGTDVLNDFSFKTI